MQRTTAALDDAGQRLSRLFLNQIIVNASFGLIIGIGLQLIGVPSAPLWGLIAMILRFVPYVGSPISAVFPLILAAAVGSGWGMLLMTAALFAHASTDCRTGGGAAGLWTQLRPLAGRHRHFGVVLDLAVGTDRAGAGNAAHRLSGRGRPPCRPPAVSRCPARQRAGTDAAATGLPADAGRRSDRGVAAGADLPHRRLAGRLLRHHHAGRTAPRRSRRPSRQAGPRADRPHPRHRAAKWSTISKPTKTVPPVEADVVETSADWRGWSRSPTPNWPARVPERWQRPGAVLCIPGSGKLDEAAAVILAQMLKRRGIGAAAETADALSMSRFFSLDLSQAAAFCICYVGKPSDAMIQYTVRRLSKKSKGGRIIIALLGNESDAVTPGTIDIIDRGRQFRQRRGFHRRDRRSKIPLGGSVKLRRRADRRCRGTLSRSATR